MSVRQTTSFVSSGGRKPTSALQPMDLLSAVLRELRFQSAAYRWLELGAPFRIVFDQPVLRGVHLITQGRCDLVLDDGTDQPLTAGDLVVLPRGDTHSEAEGGQGQVLGVGVEINRSAAEAGPGEPETGARRNEHSRPVA